MLKKHKNLFDFIASKVIQQEIKSRNFSKRIENEISEHKKAMQKRRDSFKFIRNK
jgi:hypothetical protein